MSQYLRPDSNITQTLWTNGYAEIDESSYSDSDYAYSTNNQVATLEVGLSDPGSTPDSGINTIRYRIAKTNAGTVAGTGNSLTVTASLREGASTQIVADSARTPNGTWTEYSFTFNTSAISDWTDLRLRFVTTASGGSPTNRRGCGLSWAEVEAQNASGISGVCNTTLETLYLNSTGDLFLDAIFNKSLDSLSLDGNSDILIDGFVDNTLASITLSESSDLLLNGGLNKTLDSLTSNLDSDLLIEGNLSKVLDGLTSNSIGLIKISGSANNILANLELNCDGSLAINSNLTKTLDPLFLSGTGLLSLSAQTSENIKRFRS